MNESQNAQAYQIFSQGLVQGVSYRRFIQQHARNLQLTGWTRNLGDGRVETYVIVLRKDQLDNFTQILKRGPHRSRVDKLEVLPAAFEALQGFEIRD
jgi:acylphosphatase